MNENSFVSIRNATIASVVAGLILVGVPLLRGYVVNIFQWVWSGILWCWEILVDSYSLPGWGWLLVSIFALIGLVNIYFSIRGEAEEPEFKSYVKDIMYGVEWRWNWVESKIFNLWCYCPSCDATLVYDDTSCFDFYTDIRKTDFICENCNHSVVSSINGGGKDYAIDVIKREISRRIRTGEYQKH